MPLSMLLSKNENRKKRPGGSKTRSITDKQLSFPMNTRMPSNSLVSPQELSAQYRRPSFPSKGLTSAAASSTMQDKDEEGEDEGWFTS